MNIALVILHTDPARGGAERYTVDLADALARRGHAVTVLSVDPPAAGWSWASIQLNFRGVTRTKRYRRFLQSLEAHLDQTHYDIVHAMLPVTRCDVYHPHAGIAAEAVQFGHLKHRSPVRRALARFFNRFNSRRRAFARVERRLLTAPNPPRVLCLSELVKQSVRRHYPLDDAHLPTLFNAVDLDRFDPQKRPDAGRAVRERFGIAEDRIVALMIAQDFERKGLRPAIDAVAQVDDPRLVLLVVGKEDPASYKAHAAGAGVAERVIFAGATDDPYAFYRAAEMFVLPTRHDPCSLVVLEALAMGVPVVSTVHNGACEIVANGVHGFVLPDPDDAAAIADSLRRLLDPRTRHAMTHACLNLRLRLSYEHHLDELLSLYQRGTA